MEESHEKGRWRWGDRGYRGYKVADILFKLGRDSAFRLNDVPGMLARALVRRAD